MGVAQANDVGGVFDRKVELVSRDDGGKPEEAVRIAGELLNEEKVDLLAGGSSSNVGLALRRLCRASQEALMSPAYR